MVKAGMSCGREVKLTIANWYIIRTHLRFIIKGTRGEGDPKTN